MDYYQILEVKRDCSDAELKAAYRKWALRWHPLNNITKDSDLAAAKFQEITEAYVVLNDAKRRAVYDQYGEKGLKQGAGGTEGWSFAENPEDYFSQFFGATSPFLQFFGPNAGLSTSFGDMGTQSAGKLDAIEANLYCTLEELYTGCSRRKKIVRQRLALDGKTTSSEEAVLNVEVGQGWKEGTKITFNYEGDEAHNCEPGDVVFTLRSQPHARFRRRGDDLLYTANISLKDALTGCTIEVLTLDRRTLSIPVSDIVNPTTTKVVQNEGMPSPRKPGVIGNLVIDFNIQFPQNLTPKQRNTLQQTLP